MESINSYSSRNETCNSSKLSEINNILEITKRDSRKLKKAKKTLQSLLNTKQYKEFQKTIWVSSWNCDWKLWKSTLDQLISYILWADDKKWWIIDEIVDYLYDTFNSGEKEKKNNWIDDNHWTQWVIKTSEYRDPFSNDFFWTDISFIESCPRIQNKETESYRCSMTARINWSYFGLNLPKWNAYVAWMRPWLWCIQTLPRNKVNEKPLKSWPKITIKDWNTVDTDANFADFFADSQTIYGHRAVAFKSGWGQRYVLDPYIKIWWKLTQEPVKLETYLKYKKILKVNFYRSYWYSSLRKAS